MKKFLLIASFILALLPVEALAGKLKEAEVTPAGKYQDYIYNLTLTWEQDVEYVDPVTENGTQGVLINVNAAGHESTVLMSYKKDFDWSNGGQQYEVKNALTASLANAIMDPTTYQPYKGKIIITFPEGAVKDAAGNTNPEQVIEYEIMSSTYNYTVTPAQYQTYNSKSLKDVTITFSGTIERVEPIQNIKVASLTEPLSEDCITIKENAIVLDLSDLPAGNQSITVPMAYVIVTAENGDKSINGAVNLTYDIWNGMDKGTFISPKYTTIGSLETPVAATWNYQTVTASEFDFYAKISSYMSNINEDVPEDALQLVTVKSEGFDGTPSGDDPQTGNVLRIDLSSYVGKIKSGSMITIDIPAGCVEGEDGPNPAQSTMFTYYAPMPAEAEVSKEDDNILITWPGINGMRSASGPSLILEGPRGYKEELGWYSSYLNPNGSVEIAPDKDGNTNRVLKVDLSKLDLKDGKYRLTVPTCSVLLFTPDNNSYSNSGIEFNFEVGDASAGRLSDAEVSPAGKYQDNIYNLTLTWEQDVEYVDPVTENGTQGVLINVNAAGHESTVLMSYKKDFDWSNGGQQYEVKNALTASLANAIMDPTTYQPYKGKLTITLPEGVVMDAVGNSNPGQVIEYEIVSSTYDYTVTPAQYQTYNSKSLKEVTITFNGTIERVEPVQNIKIGSLTEPLAEDCITMTENAIILDLSDLPAGNQVITVPMAYVIVTGENGDKSINGAVSLTYDIWNGMDKGTFISPNYTTVGSLETPVEATWNYQTVTATEFGFYVTISSYMSNINEDVPAADVQLVTVDSEGSEGTPSEDDPQTGNVLRIDLSSYVDKIKSGSMITIEIPAGCVEGEDGPNPVQSLMFTYYAPVTAEAEVSKEDDTIIITWPEITGLRSADGPTLILEGPDDFNEALTWYSSYLNPDGNVQIAPDEEGNPNRVVKVDLSKLNLKEGNYKLTVPTCSVLIFTPDNNSYSNSEIEFNFEVEGSSIENILSADQGTYRVYTSQGILVLTTENIDDIKNLSSGIYIVNGKKILVK